MADLPYDPTTPLGQVRMLLNDVDVTSYVFTDAEIGAFLSMEGNSVKLAAAQAIDTNADNLVLASKVLRTQDLSTDGAKEADALRKRAALLRSQVAQAVIDDDTFALMVVEFDGGCYPELAELPYVGP